MIVLMVRAQRPHSALQPSAVIDLFGIAQRIVGRVHGVANIVVAEDIAGTDDHETRKRPSAMWRHRYGTARRSALEVPKQDGDD